MGRGADLHAEDLHVVERLVTAPVAGVFHPYEDDPQPVMVAVGDEIGAIVRSGEKYPVQSCFTGLLVGLLASRGERVRAHQALAWVTLEPSHHRDA
jgi:biotin carboxyl carrier protein